LTSLISLIMRVIHTPSHSKGSISLYLEADKALVSGDVVPVPGDMPIYHDPLVLIDSIKKLMVLIKLVYYYLLGMNREREVQSAA